MGIPWQVGLTGVLFSGIFFALLTVTGLREVIINAIPHQMKLAVSAGIGLFITFVGLQSSGIIIKSDSTLVKLGHLTEAPVLLAIFGIIVTVILYAMKVPGSIFVGMIVTAVAGMLTGQIHPPSGIIGKCQVSSQPLVRHLNHLKILVNCLQFNSNCYFNVLIH